MRYTTLVSFRISDQLTAELRDVTDELDTTITQFVKDALRQVVEQWERTGMPPQSIDGQPWSNDTTRISIRIQIERYQRAQYMARKCSVSLNHLVQCVIADALDVVASSR